MWNVIPLKVWPKNALTNAENKNATTAATESCVLQLCWKLACVDCLEVGWAMSPIPHHKNLSNCAAAMWGSSVVQSSSNLLHVTTRFSVGLCMLLWDLLRHVSLHSYGMEVWLMNKTMFIWCKKGFFILLNCRCKILGVTGFNSRLACVIPVAAIKTFIRHWLWFASLFANSMGEHLHQYTEPQFHTAYIEAIGIKFHLVISSICSLVGTAWKFIWIYKQLA